jgi:hypothetical protein
MSEENVELVRRRSHSGTGLPGSVKRQRISRASSSIQMSSGTISASFPVRRFITGSRRSGDISPPPRRLSITSARTCLSCSTPTRGYSPHTAFTPVAERAAPRSSAMPSTSTASAAAESRPQRSSGPGVRPSKPPGCRNSRFGRKAAPLIRASCGRLPGRRETPGYPRSGTATRRRSDPSRDWRCDPDETRARGSMTMAGSPEVGRSSGRRTGN